MEDDIKTVDHCARADNVLLDYVNTSHVKTPFDEFKMSYVGEKRVDSREVLLIRQ